MKRIILSQTADKITIRADSYNSFDININPTNNCQLMCGSNFVNILKTKEDPNFVKNMFTEIFQFDNYKPLLLIDVKQNYAKNIKNMFNIEGIEIIMESNYLSSNGSKMTIIIFNINGYINELCQTIKRITPLEYFKIAKEKGFEWADDAIENSLLSKNDIKVKSLPQALNIGFNWRTSKYPLTIEVGNGKHDYWQNIMNDIKTFISQEEIKNHVLVTN
jgi:hypothetical protein